MKSILKGNYYNLVSTSGFDPMGAGQLDRAFSGLRTGSQEKYLIHPIRC